MPRQLKVYGWPSSRNDCPPAPNGYASNQVRYIVAAPSWRAAVAAVPGESLPHAMKYGSATGNERELAVAMGEPGQAFWRPDWQRYQTNAEWRRA